jgi:hypothetical protein
MFTGKLLSLISSPSPDSQKIIEFNTLLELGASLEVSNEYGETSLIADGGKILITAQAAQG